MNVRVDTQLADLSRDQVAVLATCVENGDLAVYLVILRTIIFFAEFRSA